MAIVFSFPRTRLCSIPNCLSLLPSTRFELSTLETLEFASSCGTAAIKMARDTLLTRRVRATIMVSQLEGFLHSPSHKPFSSVAEVHLLFRLTYSPLLLPFCSPFGEQVRAATAFAVAARSGGAASTFFVLVLFPDAVLPVVQLVELRLCFPPHVYHKTLCLLCDPRCCSAARRR